MTAVFADTSALLALLNADDECHARAVKAFASLASRRAPLVTSSYVLVETYALLGRRFGLDAVRTFQTDVAPLMDVVWVDETLHTAGLELLLERETRHLSLVDCVSFALMRLRNLDQAFAFDSHFEHEGFEPMD